MNSFKGQFFISDAPFALPTVDTFVGFENYLSGIEKSKLGAKLETFREPDNLLRNDLKLWISHRIMAEIFRF